MALLVQSGQVRLVSKVIENWRTGSIHSEVPVYPRCPNEVAEKYFPDCEGEEVVPDPSAREVPGGETSLRVNSARVSGRTTGSPPCRITCAKVATSRAVANKPACPATPPSTLAFSSCTSPWIMRFRKLRSSAVGGMEVRHAAGAL